jgi:hypothetical protein
MKTESFKLKMDTAMAEWLRSEADRRRCSIAQVIRDLVVNAMEQKRRG